MCVTSKRKRMSAAEEFLKKPNYGTANENEEI